MSRVLVSLDGRAVRAMRYMRTVPSVPIVRPGHDTGRVAHIPASMRNLVDFNRETITAALREVGQLLYEQKKVGDVAIFGGSALILQFDVAFVTEDIDALIEGDHGAVIAAVRHVGKKRGWNSTWLNEGVSIYLSAESRGHLVPFASFPDEVRVGLRVYVARPEYILAMKLRALRSGHRDHEDALMLARHLGLATIEQLMALVTANFPQEALDPRMVARIGDFARELRDASQLHP